MSLSDLILTEAEEGGNRKEDNISIYKEDNIEYAQYLNDEILWELCKGKNDLMWHKYNEQLISKTSIQQLIKSFNEGGNIRGDSGRKTLVDTARGGNAREGEMAIVHIKQEEEGW